MNELIKQLGEPIERERPTAGGRDDVRRWDQRLRVHKRQPAIPPGLMHLSFARTRF